MTRAPVYIIDTKDHILWSENKMTATHQHVLFLFKDRAKFKELSSSQFKNLKAVSRKKFIHMDD